MTSRRLAQVALGALVLGWLGLLVVACHGCGHVKPPPPSDCITACAHLQQLGCSTSEALCDRLCSSVIEHQPGFPGCVSAAPTCAAADACGGG